MQNKLCFYLVIYNGGCKIIFFIKNFSKKIKCQVKKYRLFLHNYMNLPGEKLFAYFNGCRLLAVAILILCNFTVAQGQAGADSLSIKWDSLLINGPVDTLRKDSVLAEREKKDDAILQQNATLRKEEELGIKIARDALPAVVTTTAKDSAVLNMKENMFYLYGDAKASYEDVEITSGKLIFSQATNVLSAEPFLDTTGKKASTQEFKQGGELFTYDTLKYNFKSKRAIVRNARSKYGEGYVISTQIKRNPDESIYGLGNIYTTCNLEHPHFGIRARKIKVVPGKIIASGFAKLEIQDIPTPLILPFGMFPIKQGQRSGFILPTYTLEERRGLGLQQGGYYFAVNDYLGVIAQFNIFSKGSWAAFTTAQYTKRYQYNGTFSLQYAYNKLGEVYEPMNEISKDFQVNWNHQVDPKARPGTSFGASVNFGTRSYNRLNGIGVANALNNQYGSSISYGKTWKNKPYSLTVAARHSQNTQSGMVTIGLPDINFNLGQFSPFQRKVMTGTPRWYEKITATYSVSAMNRLNFYDTAFSINELSFRDFDNGIKHTASIQTNYNIFRYLNWNISVPYNEYWNTKQLYVGYNNSTRRLDTLSFRTGFFTSRDFNISTSVSTRVYGLKTFKKGRVAGIRHVLTPSLSASYQPGFAFAPFGYMYETYLSENGMRVFKSPYDITPIGGPTNYEQNGSIGFRLDNNLQMKVRGKDSAGAAKTTIIGLVDGLSVNASYNMFADSFNLSAINMSFRTSLLKIFNVSANATFDPYKWEGKRRTSQYLMAADGGLAQFVNGNASLSFSLNGEKKNKKEQEDAIKGNDQVKRLLQNGGIDDYYDFNIPWNLSVNASINVNRQRWDEGKDTLVLTPNLTFSGGFNLTERWRVNINSGLLFQRYQKPALGYTSIDISRDLHCWQMNLNLIPFGFYRSFNFTLQVKAAVLQDLKLTRRRAFQDNSRF